MIKKLDNKNENTAEKIRALFQASYPIEAKLLNVDVSIFPPLNRKLIDFIETDTVFYGIELNKNFAALAEISFQTDSIHINSFVVHPDHFRKGLGKQLLTFILDTFDTKLFTIETGLDNIPAINLYRKLGFQDVTKWETDIGVWKIKLSKLKTPNSKTQPENL